MKSNTKIILLVVLTLLLTSSFVQAQEYGGTLVFPLAYNEDVSTLDPPHSLEVNTWVITENIFEPLVRYHPETADIIPAIAQSWDVSEDGLEYTFYLRDDVKFHNGRRVQAEDVKYTYERIMDPMEAALATRFLAGVKGVDDFQDGEVDEITGIEVLDEHTLKITLSELDVTFLNNLGVQRLGIVPKEEVERLGDDFGNNPVGAGPFKVVEWIRGDRVEVEAFEDYYQGRPYLDRVIFRPMHEASSRLASFEAEEIDLNVVGSAHYEMFLEDPFYQDYLVEVAEFWIRNIHFNLDVEELQDPRVRKAFNYAIDTELVVDRLLGGKAFPGVGYIPPSNIAFNPDLEGFDYNPEKALQLMEDAGYGPDNPISIEIIGTSNAEWGIPVVEAIMPFLEQVGMELEPVLIDGATWSHRATTGDYEAFIFSLGGSVDAIDLLATNFWSRNPRDGGNYSGYNNPEFDRYLEKAMATIDLEERIEYVQKAEEELLKDPPVWFFNYNMAVIVHQPWVHGIAANPRDMLLQPLWEVWIDETSPRR